MAAHEFHQYLKELQRQVRLRVGGRVDAIPAELLDHMEERFAELLAEGVAAQPAMRQVLEEFGEAAELARAIERARVRPARWGGIALALAGAAASYLLIAPALRQPPAQPDRLAQPAPRTSTPHLQEARMQARPTWLNSVTVSMTALVLAGTADAQSIPQHINHQGVVTVNGQRFTGTGEFKFAIVAPGGVNKWTHDNTQVGATNAAPSAAIGITVTDGVYSTRLGDPALGMTAIPAGVFQDQSLSLRVWFSDTSHGWQQLVPDPPLSSSPYAFRAADVVDGAITTSKLADAAVTADKLASDVGVWSMSPGGLSYANGNVGIGAVNPTAKLDIYADSGDIFTAAGPAPAPNYNNWQAGTTSAGWSARHEYSALAYNNRLWILGGQSGAARNDVWYSTNGSAWTQATSSAAWGTRESHAAVVFDGKMWVIGGVNGATGTYYSDAWYSTDGANWTQATSSAGWTARYFHSCVAHDGKMWVIGGYDANGPRGDVWFSSNGVTWLQATTSMGFTRYAHGSAVLNGKMWVIGGAQGSARNDVWSSTDGITWTQATASAPWSVRTAMGCVATSDKLWVLGGGQWPVGFNDVWYSADGVTWTQATASAAWSPRMFHRAVVLNDGIWVFGGMHNLVSNNDAWTLSGLTLPPLLKFTASGTLALGTSTPDENYLLDANGLIKCQSLTQVSTREAKKDIIAADPQEYARILDQLVKLPLYHYRYAQGRDTARRRIGLIAEEAPAELLSSDGKGIDLPQTIGCLIAAVKAQQAENQQLRERIAALEARLSQE